MDGQLHIEEMYAFIALDKDGTEGVVAAQVGDMMMPMVGADMDRVNSLRPHAQAIANELGVTITLCKFSVRETAEVLQPKETAGAES